MDATRCSCEDVHQGGVRVAQDVNGPSSSWVVQDGTNMDSEKMVEE